MNNSNNDNDHTYETEVISRVANIKEEDLDATIDNTLESEDHGDDDFASGGSISEDTQHESTPVATPKSTHKKPSTAMNQRGNIFAESTHLKLAILGGKGAGKSYFFQSLVHRVSSTEKSGSLAYFLKAGNIKLYTTGNREHHAKPVNIPRFLDEYKKWQRLRQTDQESQAWYHLKIEYRVGIFNQRRAHIDVEFFDGSGEHFFESRHAGNEQAWKDGFLDANVAVFCLPMWVLFPNNTLTDDDWERRDQYLTGFEEVVGNFGNLRDDYDAKHRVKSMLVLTMADDRRSALEKITSMWIDDYLDKELHYRKALQHSGKAISRYLTNARAISDIIYEELEYVSDHHVSGIPNKLLFGSSEKPWLIPVSAINGKQLDYEMDDDEDSSKYGQVSPCPAHVELPLLLALCERDNALM